MSQNIDTSDREISISRTLDAPREVVYRAFTDPRQLALWWGPRGFINTIEVFDLRVGGVWQFMMHGPDGTDYPNHVVFTEVEAPARLKLVHGARADDPNAFINIITFDEHEGRTTVTLKAILPSAEALAYVVEHHNAIEGGNGNLDRFVEQFALQDNPFLLERFVAAPPALVWAAWTDPAHLAKWFGPADFTMLRCAMDLRPGGSFHYGMQGPDGHAMWGKWQIRDVAAPRMLSVITSFSDEHGGMTRHPAAADWPLETLSRTVFEPKDGGTLMKLQWAAWRAAPHERALFDASHAGMAQGWGGMMANFDAYVAAVQAS